MKHPGRLYLYSALALVGALAGCAQEPVAELTPQVFGTAAYDEAYALADYSSGVYVGGNTKGSLDGENQGAQDVFLRNYDADGTLVWGVQFGTEADEFISRLAVDPQDNLYVTGRTEGSLDAPNQGESDLFVRKYSPAGKLLWGYQVGDKQGDDSSDIVSCGSSLYLVGTTEQKRDVAGFIAKFRGNGRVLWVREINTNKPDYPLGVQCDEKGNVYVSGSTLGKFVKGRAEGEDIFARKYTAQGKVVWTSQFDFGPIDETIALAYGAGALYLVGNEYYDTESRDDTDVNVLKLDLNGKLLWNKSYGSRDLEFSNDATTDRRGNLLVAGLTLGDFSGSDPDNFIGDAFALKLGPQGKALWVSQQGTPDIDEGYAIRTQPGGNVYLAGSSGGDLGSDSNGGYDAFLQLLSSRNGKVLWTR